MKTKAETAVPIAARAATSRLHCSNLLQYNTVVAERRGALLGDMHVIGYGVEYLVLLLPRLLLLLPTAAAG